MYNEFLSKWTDCHESTVKCIESTISILTISVVYSIKEKTDRHKTACSPLNAYSIYVFLISEHFPCGIGISASFTILMERLEISVRTEKIAVLHQLSCQIIQTPCAFQNCSVSQMK